MTLPLQADPERIAAICREHHVRRLSMSGSAVRKDFDAAHSDIDVVVEFEDVPVFGYATNFFALEESLVRLFQRPVDLLTDGSIRNPFLRKAIDRDRVLLYAA